MFRIIEQKCWDTAFSFVDIVCIHGESLDEPCDDCYRRAHNLPVDLEPNETLAVTNDDGMEKI